MRYVIAFPAILLLLGGLTCCTPMEWDHPEDIFLGLQNPRQTAAGEVLSTDIIVK